VEVLAVLRFAVLTLAVAALVPLGPMSCPQTDLPTDNGQIVERGTVVTTAQAQASAATGAIVKLTATATPSVAGAVVEYAWLQTAGPGVQIEDADSARASFAAPSLATQRKLSFMVTTRDDAGAVGRADVSIVVSADPNYGTTTSQPTIPVAEAGTDQTVVPDDTVTLDGSQSTGTSLTYHWRQVSGTSVTLGTADAAQTAFTAPAYDPNSPNILLFELAVTDANSVSKTDRVQVTVRNPALSDRMVQLDTSKGLITLRLNPDDAPISTANFLQYVDDGFYDGTIFHRVIPNFVIQGGGFLPGLEQKTPRAPIVNEASNGLSNVRGTIAMARTNDPDSATCQFFINVKNNIAGGDGVSDLDPGGVSAEGYAVFGDVFVGMDVVDAIAAVTTGSQEGYSDVPVEDVVINSIKRLPATQPGN
jgi:peptidyl-prolyl cis-trans isomerase B (cyclophilin B)